MYDKIAEISAVFVFWFTGVTSSMETPLPDWVQYGAFGLCCVMVVYLLWYIRDMGKIIREKDREYVDLLKQDIESRNKLTQALSDRPCISNDRRIRDNSN